MAKKKRKERKGIKPRVMDEKAYGKSLTGLFDAVYTNPLLSQAGAQSYDPTNFLNSIEAIKQRVASDPFFGEEEARTAIENMNAYHRRRFETIARSVKINLALFGTGSATDLAVKAILEEALITNVGLIKNLGDDYGSYAYNRVARIISENTFDLQIQQAQIKELLSERGDVGRRLHNRAKLITRDQNNKILGDLTEARHKAVGGKEYKWSTSADERVRSNHGSLDGSIQLWTTPPTGGGTLPGETGHPGSGIQCRCVSNLVFDNFENETK